MINLLSKIEQQISGLCPKGVEFKELGKILKRTKGTPITAGQMSKLNKEGAPIKIFAGGRTIAYVNYGDIPDKDVLTNESVVVKSRGIIAFEYVNKPFSHKNEFWSYYSDNPNINIKYVYYYLKNSESYFQIVGGKMSKMPQLSIPDTDNFKIPIPPLAIQDEIVKILNKFTELEAELDAELDAELEARKKQYEHYREDLLIPKNKNKVKLVTIKDIAHDSFWIMPSTPTFVSDGEVPYITSKNIRNRHINFSDIKHIARKDYLEISKNRPILENDILISMIGTIGEVAFVKRSDLDFYGQNMFLVRLNTNLINISYFLHFFDSARMKRYISSIKNNSGQGYLKSKHIDSIQIPLPSLSEQERVASILDKFDALVNDISIGLPAELNARRQQYEYYRNKLLTFPEAK